LAEGEGFLRTCIFIRSQGGREREGNFLPSFLLCPWGLKGRGSPYSFSSLYSEGGEEERKNGVFFSFLACWDASSFLFEGKKAVWRGLLKPAAISRGKRKRGPFYFFLLLHGRGKERKRDSPFSLLPPCLCLGGKEGGKGNGDFHRT